MADEISQELAQRMTRVIRGLSVLRAPAAIPNDVLVEARTIAAILPDPDSEIAWGVVADLYDGSSEVAEDIRHNRDGMRDHFSMRELYRHVLAGIAAGRATQ